MPTKKKAGARKRDNEADLAELERLRKQVAEQSKALEAEEARREEESQGKRQVSSRRQRTLVRWDGMFRILFYLCSGMLSNWGNPRTDILLSPRLVFKQRICQWIILTFD